jgi:hypothetical protein
MEAFDAERPLPFLDAHFRVGNALIRTTPALLRNNIPDTAFVVLGDDDRQWTSKLKARNRSERTVRPQESEGLSVWISHDQGGWEIYNQRTRVLRMKGPMVAILVDFTSAVRGTREEKWTTNPPPRSAPCTQCGGPARRAWSPIRLNGAASRR